MRRREFIAGIAATAATSFAQPLCAQTTAGPPGTKRIAIFHPTEPPEGMTMNGPRGFKAYFGELKKLGYIEGQNLIVERYSALGQPDRIGRLAREIVATHPDLIVPFKNVFIQVIIGLNTGIPMVGPTSDPVAYGVATNLARPDRNFTGVVIDSGLEIWTKRVQLLFETAPKMTKVGFFTVNPAFPASLSFASGTGAYVREAAQRLGIAAAFVVVAGKFDRAAYERLYAAVVVGGEKFDRAAYERTFDLMNREGVDGIVVADAAEHVTHRQVIADLAARVRLPAIYPLPDFMEVGGLMSYGVDIADVMRRVAHLTDQVLRGTKTDDIPFYRQDKYELLLNRKSARSLGLEFPATLLTTADDVIE
jgi:putative tryptophan/tyrosine transport system substrate-binding protein